MAKKLTTADSGRIEVSALCLQLRHPSKSVGAFLLRPLKRVLGVQLFQGAIFGRMKSLRLRQQTIGRASVIAGQLDHATRRQTAAFRPARPNGRSTTSP